MSRAHCTNYSEAALYSGTHRCHYLSPKPPLSATSITQILSPDNQTPSLPAVLFAISAHLCERITRVLLAYLRIRVRWPAHLCRRNRDTRSGRLWQIAFPEPFVNWLSKLEELLRVPFQSLEQSCRVIVSLLCSDWFPVCLLHLLFKASIIQPS